MRAIPAHAIERIGFIDALPMLLASHGRTFARQ
jgi:hypothetical protein